MQIPKYNLGDPIGVSTWWTGAMFDALSGKLVLSFFVGAAIGLVILMLLYGFFTTLERLITGEYNLRELFDEFLRPLRTDFNRQLCTETYSGRASSEQFRNAYHRTHTNYRRSNAYEHEEYRASSTSYERSCCEVIGVSLRATKAEIKRGYRSRLKACHPDRVSTLSPKAQAEATAETIKLREMYEYLMRIVLDA